MIQGNWWIDYQRFELRAFAIYMTQKISVEKNHSRPKLATTELLCKETVSGPCVDGVAVVAEFDKEGWIVSNIVRQGLSFYCIKLKLAFKVLNIFLGMRNSLLKKSPGIGWNIGTNTYTGWVHRWMCQVPIVKNNQISSCQDYISSSTRCVIDVRSKERGTKTPAKQGSITGRVCPNQIISYACRKIIGWVLADEVARIKGENLLNS